MINSYIYKNNFDLNIINLFAQLFLVRDLVGAPCMDGVSWTLVIELKFYILILLLYRLINRLFKKLLYSLWFSVIALSISILL